MTRQPSDAHRAICSEPIAIVGMGCRFPGGASDPRRFWDLLARGIDAITEVPPDRWNADSFYSPDGSVPGTAATRWGGFVDQPVTDFDARFFGMSPRETAHLDPMQRWLLEVSWEALEDAGIPADRLAGTPTGVFVGVFTEDTKLFQLGEANRELIGPHTGTGNAMTMAANRISYWFDFRGPSVSLDTACSSSLVALHLACQSLWLGESSVALAGGANVMFRPEFTIAESKAGMLSPDGRCKTFDAAANGYVRGEGAGMVVLKPLAAARRDEDRVHALILGTASNQDGRTPGITVPSGEAQQALMWEAFGRAGVSPGRVRYMEAHGTGTPVGDPIEAKALAAVVGTGRPEGDRCWVGSVKTNIGHLEAAAGVAGLIKATLCLKRRQIPPHLHLLQPNPEIPFHELPIRVPLELEPWPDEPGPALAAVNSFGFGGANAHAVLAAAPEDEGAAEAGGEEAEGRSELVTLSARGAESLHALAGAYVEWLADPPGPSEGGPPRLADVAWTSGVRRAHHEHRLTVVARDRAELGARLEAFRAGEEAAGLRHGRAAEGRRLAWVFSGMGPQWWAMGRQLLDAEPVFRQAIERCDGLMRRHADWSLLEEMTAAEDASRMTETWISQPAGFALQVGLATLLRSWGVTADAIVGHSTGEAAAFWAAGVVGLEEAVRIIVHRSRLQQRTAGQGRLVAVGLPLEEAREAIAGFDGISIAAVNGPASVTFSGDAAALERAVAPLAERGVFCRFLRVEVPFHSHLMDPIRADLLASLADLEPGPAELPLYSTVTGERVEGPELDSGYWWRNVREPVYFAAAVDRMIADGCDAFLEVGPHPVLTGSIGDCLRRRETEGVVVSTLRRETEERASLLDALGALHCLGCRVDWRALHPGRRRLVDLPLYPWQRERHWEESPDSVRDRLEPPVHPLLGRRRSAVRPEWQVRLGSTSIAYLGDHRVHGAVVFPAAAYVEMGVAAVREAVGEDTVVELDYVRFERALFLRDGEAPAVQTSFDPASHRFEVHSRAPGGSSWTRHAHGGLFRARRSPRPAAVTDLEVLRVSLGRELSSDECYAELSRRGFQYGPAFQGLERVHAGDDALLARIRLPEPALPAGGATGSYHVHPCLLDAGFQALLLYGFLRRPSGATYLPVAIERLVVHRRSAAGGWAYCRPRWIDDRGMAGDIAILDETGLPILELEGLRVAALEAGAGAGESLEQMLYEVRWQPAAEAAGGGAAGAGEAASPEPPASAAATWLLFADRGGTARALAERLAARGDRGVIVERGDAYEPGHGSGAWRIDPAEAEHLRRLFADLVGRIEAGELPPCRAIIHLWSLDAPPTDVLDAEALLAAQVEGPVALLHAIHALEAAAWRERPLLWIVTRGAQRVGEEDVAVAQAPIWGFARIVFHQEHADLAGGIVDLDPSLAPGDEGEADRLLETLGRSGGEDQVALRGAATLVPRLLPAPRLATGVVPPRVRPDGSYLITGGLGGLGLLYARWLIERGARRLVLAGRTPLPPRSEWAGVTEGPAAGRIAAVRELESLGASVRTVAVDVADSGGLDGLLAELRRDGWSPVRGVFHAAGVSWPRLILEMTAEDLLSTLRPKLAGGWLLHDRLRREPLDFFVLFSSIAGLGFSMGMADYAAGNAFLDGLAGHRRVQGLAANSIAWGPWGEIGMASHETVADGFVQRGFTLIRPEQGLEVMERVFEHDPEQPVVIAADWPVARRRSYPTGPPAFLGALGEGAADDDFEDGGEPVGWRERLATAEPGEREAILTGHLRESAARVLRLDPERLDPLESLGALGLDSMMAVELRNRVETSLGAGPSIVELLQGASVSDLAGLLLPRLDLAGLGAKAEGAAAGAAERTAPAAEPETGPIPLSYGQRALWFLHQREPESPAYNVAFAGRITSSVDVAALRRAVQGLVDRHPSLRTRFRLEAGQPVQEIDPEREAAFTAVDAVELSEHALGQRVEAAYRDPFDLAAGPLLRVHLFTRGELDHVLLLAAHHIILDGWSLFLLLEELRSFYPAARDGADPGLPPPAACYADHVRRQRVMLEGPEGERLWRYWSGKLDPPPAPLELPTDRPRPRLQTLNGGSHLFEVDRELTRSLRGLAASQGATLFMALLAVLQALLHRIAGQDELAIGSTTSGRSHADLSGVVGHLVNSVVLRADLSDRPTFRTLLRRARNTALGAFAHQDYPFPLLVEKLQTAWDPSRAPLFQVSLVLQNLPGLGQMRELLSDGPGESRASDLGGLRMELYPLDQQAGQHELELEVYERPESLAVFLQYNSDLFDRSTIEILGRRFTTLAASAVAEPDRRVAELEMVCEEERRERAASAALRHARDQGRLGVSRRKGVRLTAADEGADAPAAAEPGVAAGNRRRES